MRLIEYRSPVATSRMKGRDCQSVTTRSLAHRLISILTTIIIAATLTAAETRPHYGGTLRVMLRSAPDTLALPLNAAPADYWDLARTLSLIGDTLVTLDAQGHPQPALATAWQTDASAQHWQFTLRRGVRFQDGSVASPEAIAQILGAIHSNWMIRTTPDSLTIELPTPSPSLLAELALPRNLLLKRDKNGTPVGTGPFLVSEWQPGRMLKLVANEESWKGRPFVNAVNIEFGKSLRDQAIALELDRTDIVEVEPQISNSSQRDVSSVSLPVELLALVFPANSKARDPRLREALALAIDRKPIQSVLLKGAGEPAAGVLPNWMTGYSAVFSAPANAVRARALLADSRPPALNLSYDPRDPQAQLIAERIALNAHEIGVNIQVSLSGPEDVRLVRVALPSPDPFMSLVEAARQMELPDPTSTAGSSTMSASLSVEDLYQVERSVLERYAVIPLFHLPVVTAAGARVHGWEPGRLGDWNSAATSSENTIANIWLTESHSGAGPK